MNGQNPVFIPGPTNIPDALRRAMDVQTTDHRAPDFVELFARRLSTDNNHRIKAVLVTHNETATGVRSDIASVRKAMDSANHPALLYVDCVSSLASMDFAMDDWGVDLAVSGSQKGFMLTTGMAMADLNYPVELSAGASAAQEYYRSTTKIAHAKAA